MTTALPPAGDRDAQTIELLRRGEQDGIRQLLEDHGGAVVAALRRNFGRFLAPFEVDEALEAALVRIWIAAAGPLPVNATLRSWLFVIARNCGLSMVRRRRRRHELPFDEFEEMLGTFGAAALEQERLRRLADLHNCLRELPRLQRIVLQADLDAGGIAPIEALLARCQTNAPAIYVARSCGRAELRRMMQRLGHFVDAPAPRRASRPEPEFG